MKCLTCQNELPDTAISCPRCGTPTRAAASFSYLPADAPPWPATVSGTATAVKQTIEPVAPSTAKSTPDAKPGRSIGSVFTAMLLLILSVVVGVGATLAILAANGYLISPGTTSTQQAVHLVTPSPTAAATTGTGTPTAATPTTGTTGNQLPTPSSFVALKVTEVGIFLKYPADWIQGKPQTTSASSEIDFRPQQQLGIIFVVQRFTANTSAQVKSVVDLNQSILQPPPNDTTIRNFKLVQAANPTPMIAGVSWAEQDATFTNSQGILFHEVSASVQHNNLYYNINYLAPDVVYAEAMQKYYSQMLTSFQFLS